MMKHRCLLAVLVLAMVVASTGWPDAERKAKFSSIFEAIENGTPADVEACLEAGADINAEIEYGLGFRGRRGTPLDLACRKGSTEVVKLLLARGAQLNPDNKRTPALFWAAGDGHKDCVEILLAHGAEINAKSPLRGGSTALHAAAWCGHEEVVRLLLKRGADFEAKDEAGFTPLASAKRSNHEEVAKLLLAAGASYSIHDAATFGDLEAVRERLLASPELRQERNPAGRTPLHCASAAGKLQVVQYLLEQGADVDALDADGLAAIHLAVSNERSEVVRYLKQAVSSAFVVTDCAEALAEDEDDSDNLLIGVTLPARLAPAPGVFAKKEPRVETMPEAIVNMNRMGHPDIFMERFAAAAVYDPAQDFMLVQGGAMIADFWFGNCHALGIEDGWRSLKTMGFRAPGTRFNHEMSEHPSGDGVVLFSGNVWPGQVTGNLWWCNRQGWTLLDSDPPPSARVHYAMATDIKHHRLLLFGGIGVQAYSDTWIWDGKDWIEVPDSQGPGLRVAHEMVYDASRDVFLLFGGLQPKTDQIFDDTWTFDGNRWTMLSPKHRPPARTEFGLVFDSRRGVVVLYGGRRDNSLLKDTWEWDGNDWREKSPWWNTPGARAEFVFCYHKARGRAVLFGGTRKSVGPVNDTWAWDGKTWTCLQRSTAPKYY